MIEIRISFGTLAEAQDWLSKHGTGGAPFPFDSIEEARAEAAAPAPAVTVEELRKALADCGKAHGRDAAVQLLASFGAKNVSDLKVDQYAAVVAAAKEL